jgi:hypothetical protein
VHIAEGFCAAVHLFAALLSEGIKTLAAELLQRVA